MKNFKIIIVIFFLYFKCAQVEATQTVFNVPSADVTPKGHFYGLQENQFNGSNPNSNYDSTIFADYGIGHNTEVGVILFNVGAPASENISTAIGFKSAIPIPVLKEKFPKREFKLTVGSNVLIGLEGNGVGNWTYTHLSGRLPITNTRLTAGISYGTRQVFGVESTAFIAAVEQPITKKFNLIGDWYSGDEHWAGFLIVGGSYALPKNTTIYAGYQIPNDPKFNTAGFVLQIGKIF